jgi:hypothetical protein
LGKRKKNRIGTDGERKYNWIGTVGENITTGSKQMGKIEIRIGRNSWGK